MRFRNWRSSVGMRRRRTFEFCFKLAIISCCLVNCLASQQQDNNEVDSFLDTFVVPKSYERLQSQSNGPVKRLWGLPDITATVGKLFRFHIPSDSFSGNIHHYELAEAGGVKLPSWLHFQEATSSLEGIPLENDRGRHFISVKAVAPPAYEGEDKLAEEVFSIEVLPDWQDSARVTVGDGLRCSSDETRTLMSVVVDADTSSLTAEERLHLVSEVATKVGVEEKQLQMLSFGLEEHTFDNFAIMAGPGNSRQKKTTGLLIRWQVGCGGKITDDHSDGVSAIERSARDGSLAKELGFPIIGWHVTARDPRRTRRDASHRVHPTPVPEVIPTKHPGVTHTVGGYEDYDDQDSITEEDGPVPDSRIVPTMASPIFTQPSVTATHKHRHHHNLEGTTRGRHYSGEHPDDYDNLITSTPVWRVHGTPMPTPVLPVQPTVKVDEDHGWKPYPEKSAEPSTTAIVPDPTPVHKPTAVYPAPTVPVIKPKNFHPKLIFRIQKQPIIAGKIFRYQIPDNTFYDFEENSTRNLSLTLLSGDFTPLPSNSWIQFDPKEQRIFALPLEKNIGQWDYQLEARDRENASVTEHVEIHVRQDQAFRNFNHEFIMHVKYDTHRFMNVSWQIRLVEKLIDFLGTNSNHSVLVRSVSAQTSPIVFTWLDNSLSVHPCPIENITTLHDLMSTGKDESSSKLLRDAVAPEYRITKVHLNLFGNCKRKDPATRPQVNNAPKVRNHIDYINATVGKFLHFLVPNDTFFDQEDGDTRYLKLSLLTMDGPSPPQSSWIQFNPVFRLFFGLPMDEDVGHREFKIVATDREGAEASDALVVVVQPRSEANRNPIISFSIHMDIDYNLFSRDAVRKTMVLDKLAHVYGDPNPQYITVQSITKGSVVFSWTNNSLPTTHCPKEEVNKLIRVLFNENRTISHRLVEAFRREFNVTKADAMPSALCQYDIKPTSVSVTPPDSTTETEHATSEDDVYLTTVIPAVVIAAMLIIAAIIACILYRKKRKGKMNVEEQSAFLNKGIPIIFADELDEKVDPAKSPVIMKEEKPPLPPPEYPRSSGSSSPATPPIDRKPRNDTPRSSGSRRMDNDSGVGSSGRPGMFPVPAQENSPPYQPPPPFTTNRDTRMNRPKHTSTPTYRMPPPYVPP